MAVTFTNDELDLFNKNGISDDDIQATVDNYRSQGLDDNAIRQKVDVKLNALKGAVVTPELKGVEGETVTEPSVDYGTKQARVERNVRNYSSRFPDRTKNFLGNAASDVKDVVQGLSQIAGNVGNFFVARPIMNVALGDKNKSFIDNLFTGEGIQDVKNLWHNAPETLNALKEGLKENYGQGGIDMISKKGLNVDLAGLGQSLYAHPLNLLDLVGLGEVGKLKNVAKLTKGGQVSDFAKTVGNKTLKPKYSENLVYNLGQRIAETKPVQNVVSAIDQSPFRPATDVVADFLNISPESRLMGEKGAAVRTTKQIEQANQTKNIAERNKAIAENQENLSGLTDVEAKELVKSIESGNKNFKITKPEEIKAAKTQFEQDLKDLQVNVSKPQYVTRSRQGNFWRENIDDSLTISIREAGEELNSIIKEIQKNPDIVNDYAKVEELEKRLDKKLGIDYDFDFEHYSKFYQALEKAQDYNLLKSTENKVLETPNSFQLTPKMQEIKDALRNKAQQNADFYIEKGLLDEQTVKDLPVNTYASIKYNKPITELSDAEKLDALKDIEKMPKEQQPFYVPMMFDDKLRASDFFANSTKRYKPNELKQRKVGMGIEETKTGGKRVYNPVELANRLDAHRIKMVNTENMINEIIDNFAKPLDLSKEKVLDGYVPFNPDSFLKFYKKSIDLNETTLRKLSELDNIDTALKASVEDAIKTLPDDIIEVLGVTKNNKIYQIPEEVAKTLTSGKNAKGIWESMLDMGTAGFKRKVLGLSPKWFINNRIGNGIMAGLKGVNAGDLIKALNVSDDLLPDALKTKSMYEAEKTIIGRTGGGNNSTFGNTMRLLGGEFIDTSELKGLQKAGVTLANSLGVPGKVINAVTDAMFKFNQSFETLERKASYLHSVDTVGKQMLKTTGQNIVKQDELLKATLNNEDVLNAVLKDVDNTLGDYINMTTVERRNLRKIIPFYSWLRTITRYTLSLAETNPIRADLANKISMLMKEDNEDIPEYQRGSIGTNFVGRKTGKPLRLNYEHSIPFSTFGDTSDNPIGIINPLLTRAFETATGRNTFMNKPFVSRNYENVFPNGYASLDESNKGEFYNELPMRERIKALPVGIARTTIPALDWFERVGVGSLLNLINRGELMPYDALYDTSLGGYNYDEGFYKNPKGWSNEEQLLKTFLPIQQEGVAKKKVKTKRKK